MNSIVYQTQQQYNTNILKDTHCPTLRKIKTIIDKKQSEDIFQYFFIQLHNYITGSLDSSNQPCKDSSCLAHQLFNISLKEGKMKEDGVFENPVDVNEFIYFLNLPKENNSNSKKIIIENYRKVSF